ncbi:MAG: hypothetical protein JXB62_19070 [Pirellulales bacterium]|nr:hypothetical protein [Pirellulales bacterium]
MPNTDREKQRFSIFDPPTLANVLQLLDDEQQEALVDFLEVDTEEINGYDQPFELIDIIEGRSE